MSLIMCFSWMSATSARVSCTALFKDDKSANTMKSNLWCIDLKCEQSLESWVLPYGVFTAALIGRNIIYLVILKLFWSRWGKEIFVFDTSESGALVDNENKFFRSTKRARSADCQRDEVDFKIGFMCIVLWMVYTQIGPRVREEPMSTMVMFNNEQNV